MEDPAGLFAAFSPAVQEAWRRSFMTTFPDRIVRTLLERARETRVEAGQVFYRGDHHGQTAMLALVAHGMLRVYLRAESGRQVTVHYAGPGSVVGLPALLLAGARHDNEQARQHWLMLGGRSIQGQALQDSVIVPFDPGRFLRLVRTEVEVAWPLATYLARRVVESQQMLADDMFLSVRARVARHLIDLAVRDGDVYVVTVGHQEIADAIGSVREVVSRALGELRDERLIAREGGNTVLLDVARLQEIAADGVTRTWITEAAARRH
jgi:CRP-like cAMP-binding protein